MNLSGLEVYDKLPQTDCGECKSPSCLSFAIRLVRGQKDLDHCLALSNDIKQELEKSIPLAF